MLPAVDGKDDDIIGVSLAIRQLSLDVIPRDRGLRPLNVIRPTAVQFRRLVGRQVQAGLTFGFRQAFPQRHREFGSFAGREFQELGECRGHDPFSIPAAPEYAPSVSCAWRSGVAPPNDRELQCRPHHGVPQ